MQTDLVNMLFRFRRYLVGIVCNISDIHLQCKIKDKDRLMFRILWRYHDEKKSPITHTFPRILFGMNTGTSEVYYVVRHNAEKYQTEYLLTAETVLESTYMDDIMDSTEMNDNAINLYEELKKLWKLCGMKPY